MTNISRNVLAQLNSVGQMTGVLNIDGKLYSVSLTGLDALQPVLNTASAPSPKNVNSTSWVAINTVNSVALSAILQSGVVYPGDVPGDNAQYVFQPANNTTAQNAFGVNVPTTSVGAI